MCMYIAIIIILVVYILVVIFAVERFIPNPPTNLQVSDYIDTRIGFFGHAVLNISWEGPQSKNDLILWELRFNKFHS